MAMDEDEKTNNLTKRALFKEKLSDINIENQVCFSLSLSLNESPNLYFLFFHIF